MAQEVQVCSECGRETVEWICSKHGLVQTVPKDFYDRVDDGTKEREEKVKIKDNYPDMTAKEVDDSLDKKYKKKKKK